MFSRGGQSQPKHIEGELEHRVDELEQVVDALETRLDAIESSLTAPLDAEPDAVEPDGSDRDDVSDGHEARVHVLRPIAVDELQVRSPTELASSVVDPVASEPLTLETAVTETAVEWAGARTPAVLDDHRHDELSARLDIHDARLTIQEGRLGAVAHAVELLALRVDELAHRHQTRAEPPVEPSSSHDTIAALRDLQLSHARLAVEQARVEQLFREDLAALAERMRRLGRPSP